MKPRKIVIAYSGGLDTSAAVHFLKNYFKCEIHAYCADLGQNEDWDKVEKRAFKAGADSYKKENLQDHFINDFVFEALKGNGAYENNYLLGTPLARPAIVEGMIKYAHEIGADSLSHGCTTKGNDQIRFELGAILLDSNLKQISPWRIWPFKSREDLQEYCNQNNIEVLQNKDDLLSHDENLVHYTTEGEYLEYLENSLNWKNAKWITCPEKAPNEIEKIKITFEKGIPKQIDRKNYSSVELIKTLNQIGGRNGVGMQDIIENRINGMKVRGIFENPALIILHKAHRHLECTVLNNEVQRIKESLTNTYGDIIYRGLWFSEERKVIQALINKSQDFVSGEVEISMIKGYVYASAVSSTYSLYSRNLVTLHKGDDYDQTDSKGFINTLSYRLLMESGRKKNMQ